jgi:hypothetical protein
VEEEPDMKETRKASANASSGHRGAARHDAKIRLLKVNYDTLARTCGENAYNRAKEAGLSDEAAEVYQEIWGAPITPEDRVS